MKTQKELAQEKTNELAQGVTTLLHPLSQDPVIPRLSPSFPLHIKKVSLYRRKLHMRSLFQTS